MSGIRHSASKTRVNALKAIPPVGCLRPRWRLLAANDGRDREQALLTLASALKVVEEFEIALAQLQDCNVGGGADIERAAVVKRRENARGIDRAGCDHSTERHVEHEKLRHDVRHVNNTGGP